MTLYGTVLCAYFYFCSSCEPPEQQGLVISLVCLSASLAQQHNSKTMFTWGIINKTS